MPAIRLAIADDHNLVRKGLMQMLEADGFNVVADAENGRELIDKIANRKVDLVLMDIQMPVMNGAETTEWLRDNMPEVKVLALSMFDDDLSVIRIIKSGARGCVLKDAQPGELYRAIAAVVEKGFYYTEMVAGKLMDAMSQPEKPQPNAIQMNDRELAFLQLACSELSYKEIADKMFLSPRTIDGYREALFERLGAKSRIGLVLYAIRHEIFKV
jgi:two-component system, NarL family, invasion response regulator UvrY